MGRKDSDHYSDRSSISTLIQQPFWMLPTVIRWRSSCWRVGLLHSLLTRGRFGSSSSTAQARDVTPASAASSTRRVATSRPANARSFICCQTFLTGSESRVRSQWLIPIPTRFARVESRHGGARAGGRTPSVPHPGADPSNRLGHDASIRSTQSRRGALGEMGCGPDPLEFSNVQGCRLR